MNFPLPRRVSTLSFSIFIFLLCIYFLSFSTSLTSRNYGEGFLRLSVVNNLFEYHQIIAAPGDAKWGVPGRWGYKYNWHEFGQNFFALPLYIFLPRDQGYGFFIVNAVAGSLTCVLIFRLLVMLGYRIKPSAITALLYGVGTMAWHYASKTSHEHALAIFFIVGSYYYAFRYLRGEGARYLVYAAICLGFGVTTRNDVLLSVIPLCLFIYLERNRIREKKLSFLKFLAVSALTLAPFAAFVLLYNYVRFESVFNNGYGYFLQDRASFSPSYIPAALLGLVLSPGRSIFIFSPVIILFPFAIKRFFKTSLKGTLERSAIVTLVAFICTYFIFYLNFFGWDGAYCYGPRLELVIVPFMVMPLVVIFSGWRETGRLKKALIILLVVASIMFQIISVSSNTWLSNAFKYGADDDSNPNVQRRSFGPDGSWESSLSFMVPRYSQPFNMARMFYLTMRYKLDNNYLIDYFTSLNNSEVKDPIVIESIYYYHNLLEDYCVWWLEKSGSAVVVSASFLGFAALTALFSISRLWK